MSYEMTFGLLVDDPAMYSDYRARIAPLLREADGAFRFDVDVAHLVHAENAAAINRMYVIRFPDRSAKERFFADPRYLAIRHRFYERAVTATVVIAEYVEGAARQLADRLEQGADALASFASTLTAEEWRTRAPHDGRTVGVLVHHVASAYPIEIEMAQTVASGRAVTGVTWDDIHAMNAAHAAAHAAVTREAAIDLLQRNSRAASAAVRALTNADLAQAAQVSLYADAPVTCQFVLEDHAVRHSYHHLARLRAIRPRPVGV